MIDYTTQEQDWRSGTLPGDLSGPEVKWFAVHVRIRYEKFVGDMLLDKGYETFAPLYRHKRRYGSVIKESQLPLFPGYTFCRLNPNNRLPVLITPGVIKLLGTGKIPRPVDDTEMAALRKAAAANIAMTPTPFLTSGQTGRVSRGPLAGVEGVVMQNKGALRLVLSVTLLQRSVLLEIDSSDVKPCAAAPHPAPLVMARQQFSGYSASRSL